MTYHKVTSRLSDAERYRLAQALEMLACYRQHHHGRDPADPEDLIKWVSEDGRELLPHDEDGHIARRRRS